MQEYQRRRYDDLRREIQAAAVNHLESKETRSRFVL
jgi:hypothetical protein